MANIWDCPLCGGVVDTSGGKRGRLPAACRLKNHSVGEECLAYRDLERAEKILKQEGGD